MRDFTSDTLNLLLSSLKSAGYRFTNVAGYLDDPSASVVILRHDVDAKPGNSLRCAELENRMGMKGSYYFRMVPKSYDEPTIREIARLGHEIGYHYEDLAVAKGNFQAAISLFAENLAKLRRLAPIETICMHGSPMSKYDNRKLWNKYDYREFGIRGEPYLDIDFREVLYLTDTGRRWDGERYSIRDRVTPAGIEPDNGGTSRAVKHPGFHSTFDIIKASDRGKLPLKIMITIHPQRWNAELMPWVKELLVQNTKNVVKSLLRGISRG